MIPFDVATAKEWKGDIVDEIVSAGVIDIKFHEPCWLVNKDSYFTITTISAAPNIFVYSTDPNIGLLMTIYLRKYPSSSLSLYWGESKAKHIDGEELMRYVKNIQNILLMQSL